MPSEVSAIMNELPDLAEAQVEDVALKEEAISGEEQVNLDENEETPKKKRNKKSRPLNPKVTQC